MEDRSRENRIAVLAGRILTALGQVLAEDPTRRADPFYAGRVEAKDAFSGDELAVATYVYKHFQPSTVILELGCGYGQLCLLLACLHFKVLGIEAAQTRYAGAQSLQHFLLKTESAAASVQFIRGTFPLDVSPPHDLFIATNVVNSFWSAWGLPDPAKYSKVLTAKHVIVDTRLWWTVREDPAQQREVLDAICATGYACTEHITSSCCLFQRTT